MLLSRFFALLPLTVFMLTASLWTDGQTSPWLAAFLAGGGAAAGQLVWFLCRRVVVNRLVLAVDLYLLAGGLAVGLGVDEFLRMLNMMRETGLMSAIFLVGLASTFLSRAGFVGCPDAPANLVRRYSLALLATAALALAASFAFQGRLLLSGVIPIVLILTVTAGLRRRLARTAASCD